MSDMTRSDRPILVTVAVCTWNRADLLRNTLERMTELVIPAGTAWELIVVDNGSTDATPDVLREFQERLPLHPSFEAAPGHTNARNRAVHDAAGEYILWTDDDVLVDPRWIDAYCRAFRQWPDAAAFGGPIEPWFPTEPPEWLRRAFPRVSGAFAVRNLGTEPFPLAPGRLPFGANMAVRTAEQRAHLFDPKLGYCRNRRTGGDEEAMMQAVLADGATGWWVPDARVQHYVPRARMTRRYLREYYNGRGEVLASERAIDGPMLFGSPVALWKAWLVAEAKYAVRNVVGGPEFWVDHLCTASELRGSIRAFRSRGRSKQAG
jgi:glycosyltransferase involved in cell wall biosynthesis